MWELDYKESLEPKNWYFWTAVLEKTLESPLDCKDIKQIYLKGNQPWIFIGRTDAESEALATWWEGLTHWKRPWCWERLKAGGEGDERGWDDRMASPTLWTWVWASSRCWWWTGKPGTLQSMGSQNGIRLSHWTELLHCGQILYCLSHQGSLIYVRGRFPLIALVFYWQWFNHWHLYCSSWVIKRNLNLSFHNLRKKRCIQCILGRV